jgi:hypothetical protein
MKKIVFLSSVCLLLTGGGLKLATAPANAATPLLIAQNNPTPNSTQLELLSVGAEPRQELRFKPKANTQQTMTMTMNMDVATSFSGQAMPKVKIPATVMKMEVAVTQVDANGDIHSQFAYTDADVVADSSVPPEMLNAIRTSIKKMVGLKGTSICDHRGQIKSSNFVLPEGSDPITKQLLDQVSNSFGQFASPVPQEAVGMGAKWRVSYALKLGGINVNQTAIYELVSLKDNVATFNIALEQQANAQKLTLPGLPSEANISLKSLTSQGQGQMILPLDAVMPSSSMISIQSTNEMSIKDPRTGKEMPISTQLSMQINLESQFSK